MDLQGNFLDVNRSTEELSGYDRQELIGRNFQSLPLLDDRQNLMMAALLQQATHGEILGPVEHTLNRKDGGQVIIEAKGLPLQRQGKNLLLVIARDITARKLAEEALPPGSKRRNPCGRASKGFGTSPTTPRSGFGRWTPRGNTLYSSPVVEQLLGYKPEEVLGKYFYDFFLPDQREELKERHAGGIRGQTDRSGTFSTPTCIKTARSSGCPPAAFPSWMNRVTSWDTGARISTSPRGGQAEADYPVILMQIPAHGRDHPGCLLDGKFQLVRPMVYLPLPAYSNR